MTDKVAELRKMLNQYDRNRAAQAGGRLRYVSTGLVPLDEVLPRGGLPYGAVTELYTEQSGIGVMSLAFRMAGRQLEGDEGHRRIVYVDTRGDFHPPGVWQAGVSTGRLVVVRLRNKNDAFWVVDQALRCVGVCGVVAPIDRLDERQSRRLQLAAKSSGAVGLIMRSTRLRTKSFAAVQLLVEGVSVDELVPAGQDVDRVVAYMALQGARLCRLSVLSARGGMSSGSVLVDVHHESGVVSVPSLSVDGPIARAM